MEEILESIINGQRRQALEQLKESAYTLDDLFDELYYKGMYKEIITMYRVAINNDYITFN